MPARKKTRTINLLPKDEFEISFVGKFLKWAMTMGRHIVIGTELVVIVSFLARFSFDRQMTDLNELIAQKQAVVASYADFENQARSVQSRLNLVESLEVKQLNSKLVLEHISSFTPMDVVYSNIDMTKNDILIIGTAFSEAGFRTLLAELRSDGKIKKVELNRVESKGDEGAGIDFDIKLILMEEKNAL